MKPTAQWAQCRVPTHLLWCAAARRPDSTSCTLSMPALRTFRCRWPYARLCLMPTLPDTSSSRMITRRFAAHVGWGLRWPLRRPPVPMLTSRIGELPLSMPRTSETIMRGATTPRIHRSSLVSSAPTSAAANKWQNCDCRSSPVCRRSSPRCHHIPNCISVKRIARSSGSRVPRANASLEQKSSTRVCVDIQRPRDTSSRTDSSLMRLVCLLRVRRCRSEIRVP